MLTIKEIKHYESIGICSGTLGDAERFLEDGNFELHNIAEIGSNEYRVMFKDKDGKLTSVIRPIPS